MTLAEPGVLGELGVRAWVWVWVKGAAHDLLWRDLGNAIPQAFPCAPRFRTDQEGLCKGQAGFRLPYRQPGDTTDMGEIPLVL